MNRVITERNRAIRERKEQSYHREKGTEPSGRERNRIITERNRAIRERKEQRVITERNRAIRERKEQGSQGEEKIIIIEVRSTYRVTIGGKETGQLWKGRNGEITDGKKGVLIKTNGKNGEKEA